MSYILKEDAKDKFCPLINAKCVTDKCMAWKPKVFYEKANMSIMPPKPKGISNTEGYCCYFS